MVTCQLSKTLSTYFDFMLMRSALFWDITWRRMVIVYRRFRTTYRSHLHGSKLLIREDGTDTLSRNIGKQLLTREDGTNKLSRNVGKQFPHDAA
jgi:hypothetical protein